MPWTGRSACPREYSAFWNTAQPWPTPARGTCEVSCLNWWNLNKWYYDHFEEDIIILVNNSRRIEEHNMLCVVTLGDGRPFQMSSPRFARSFSAQTILRLFITWGESLPSGKPWRGKTLNVLFSCVLEFFNNWFLVIYCELFKSLKIRFLVCVLRWNF